MAKKRSKLKKTKTGGECVRDFKLKGHPRSDGKGTRVPFTIRATEDLKLDFRTARGKRVDGRSAIYRRAKHLLHELVAELGGPDAITTKQRLEINIVLRQTLLSEGLFDEHTKAMSNGEDIDPLYIRNRADQLALNALGRCYK